MRSSSSMPMRRARSRSSSLRKRKRAWISPPRQRSAAAVITPSGAPPMPMTACTPVPDTAALIAAERSPSEVLGGGEGYGDVPRRRGPDTELLEVGVRGVQQAASLRRRDDRDRVRLPLGHEVGSLERVD